jgi:hypothetical protein
MQFIGEMSLQLAMTPSHVFFHPAPYLIPLQYTRIRPTRQVLPERLNRRVPKQIQYRDVFAKCLS